MTRRARPYTEGLDKRLRNAAYAADYLTAAAEQGKADLLLALRDVARARGVSKVAKQARRGRESLYKTLSEDGNPELETLLNILGALDLKLHFDAA